MSRLVRAIEPTDLRAEDTGTTRFVIRAWLWATPFNCAFLFIYLLHRMFFQSVVQLVTIAIGVLLLALVKLGVSIRFIIHASLFTMSASFVGTALGQTPFDPSSVFFLSIMPLVATYALSARAGMVWGAINALLGVLVIQLGQRGFHLGDVDPDLGVTMSLNYVFLLTLSLVYGRASTEERDASLSRARAADRAKSIFLANVSHEIRTPMNGVVGMTEVLLQGAVTDEQREQLDVIRRSGQSLVLLINDLLDLARVEEGVFALDPVRFDLRMLAADLVKLYGPLALAKGIALENTIEPDVPTAVRGDALRLRQVLANLLSNAVKFTSEGRVHFAITNDQDRIRFSVTDTGPGISEAVRSRLFRRFEQGDASATRRAGGTGLGLALSHEFVRLMGGALAHDPTHTPGSRFTFALSLPVESTSVPNAAPVLPSARNDSKPVLVVDDNPINLAVARSLIGNAGYRVHTATNGREALVAIQQREWSLVLMDVQMPEMDGLEATRQIRALPGHAGQLPIIALTASAMPDDVAACREAGMSDMLTKPIDLQALSKVLERYARSAAVD